MSQAPPERAEPSSFSPLPRKRRPSLCRHFAFLASRSYLVDSRAMSICDNDTTEVTNADWSSMGHGRSSLVPKVVGLLLLWLLGRFTYVQAACFEGSFVNDTWISAGCLIPEPDRAAGQCLVAKNLLFMGGSTTRNIFHTLCARLNVEVQHHPCNMYMGWGCHDCTRGCRSPPNPNWQDAYARTASGTQLTFSWKPEMLTTDDILFLKRFMGSGNNIVDAVIVHKGIHDAMDWHQQHKANNYSYHDFELEMHARAEILAETLREYFPNSALFWRDAFYNGKDAELEEINNKLRPVTQTRFMQQGFHILPGHHVSMTAEEYHEGDGLHPHESVNDVMLSMIAGVLCP